MDDLIGAAGLRADHKRWPLSRKLPKVVVVAGVDRSSIVDAALADPALTDPALGQTLLPRFESGCVPPCDAILWRLETATGEALNTPGLLGRYWHRKPYAMTIRLACYQPRSTMADVLDEGTIGTRGPWQVFHATVERMAMRFVRDAALGRSRGPATMVAAVAPYGRAGSLDHMRSRWRDRLTTEWWSLGTSEVTPEALVRGGSLDGVHWYSPEAGDSYLADPFPWPGSGMILAEEMPRIGGTGRIVALTRIGSRLSTPVLTLVDDGCHHSYPCTLQEGEDVFCVPESVERGATWIHRLNKDGALAPICQIAPHARLADPTLFRWNERYWLACTDLDIGAHDNLCLLHAPSIEGPWVPHALWPVKVDIRGARPAGALMNVDGRLYRPAQDCAVTYGAGIALHEITRLSETEFAETLVSVLRPDPSGPFPDGLHTLNHDGERFWIDGKRFVRDLRLAREKLRRRAGFALSAEREAR